MLGISFCFVLIVSVGGIENTRSNLEMLESDTA
jgi:hypothetical protein